MRDEEFVCLSRENLYLINIFLGVRKPNIISNVIILVMAIFGVAALQLSLRRQILLALMLGIGSFTCVSSVCRLVYDARVEGSSDFTATVWPVYLWT